MLTSLASFSVLPKGLGMSEESGEDIVVMRLKRLRWCGWVWEVVSIKDDIQEDEVEVERGRAACFAPLGSRGSSDGQRSGRGQVRNTLRRARLGLAGGGEGWYGARRRGSEAGRQTARARRR